MSGWRLPSRSGVYRARPGATAAPYVRARPHLTHHLEKLRKHEGQVAWGYDDARYQAVTIKDGRAVEVNEVQFLQ